MKPTITASALLALCLLAGCASPYMGAVPFHITLSNSPETMNDLKVYRSKKEEVEAISYAWEELPKERQINLAYHLLNDTNGLTVYRGCQLLIKNGREEDCFNALAKIIAEGKDKTHLNGSMGWDWIHNDDRNLFPLMMKGILTSLNNNYPSYSPDEKERVLSFFKNIGYIGDYDKQRVKELIDLAIKKNFVGIHKKQAPNEAHQGDE